MQYDCLAQCVHVMPPPLPLLHVPARHACTTCTHPCLAAARLLAPGEGQPAGQGAFALFGKTGRSPRVYCCAGREGVLKAIQVR